MKFKRLYSQTIFRQLVTFTLLIGIVPLIIISITQFTRMKNMAEREMVNSHQQVISQYIKNIEEKLSEYYYKTDLISGSTVVQETLLSTVDNSYSKGARISEEVTKYLMLEKSSEISNCMIYSMVKENPVYGKRVSTISNAEREGWYGLTRALDDGWYTYYSRGMGEELMTIVKKIINYNYTDLRTQQLGIVKLDIRLNELFEPAKYRDKSSFFVLLYDDSDSLLYCSEGLEEDIFVRFLEERKTDENMAEEPVMMNPYIFYQGNLEEYGIHFLFFFENSELNRVSGEVMEWMFPIIFVLVILIVVMASFYTKNFSRRIQFLLGKIRSVESGDLRLQGSIDGNDEIAMLDKEFDRMLCELNRLIERNYIQQLENKETQLRNLQLQINPHFLYNTLETISSMAAVNQSFVICDLCEKLGEIFRYSLGKDYGEFVTVEQELHHTQNYIFIQLIRFSDRFDVVYHLDKTLSQKRIPRFILQPIVENAILHGLVHMAERGTLEISTREEESCLVIGIEDNGEGMNLQKLESLREYMDNPQVSEENKGSVGVRNVNQRIKMSCGEQYGIQISSAPFQGSCFELWLPLL
ncbi:MAG: histidine kinase [Lachnospiraceae bacterium]|nr:histidine kinase [Lachnospiraceae bacterium]